MVKSPESISDRIIDAALELAAETSWRRVALHEIAERAGVTLAACAEEFPTKGAILVAFGRRIDQQVLENLEEPVEGEGARDRLFGVVMKRFDALRPYKPAIAGILRAPDGDLGSLAVGACRYLGSMGLMLEAAGVSTAGLRGRLRLQGLAALYPAVLCTWLKDDTEDMSRTMAALDRWLRNAEMLDQRLCGWTGGRARPAEPPPSPAPPPVSPRTAPRSGRRGGRGGRARGTAAPA